MSWKTAAVFGAISVAGLCQAAAPAPASPSAQHSCAPSDGLSYVCVPAASEDLARIPGTRWLVVSGLNVGAPAHLYLIDTRTKRTALLFPTAAPRLRPDPKLSSVCPGPPDLAAISTDGLNIRAGRGGQHLLLVANHGDRNAVEMFSIDARGPQPGATWIGCVPMPPGTLANAVVPLSDGGLIVSSFHDPGDKQAWARMDRGENTGSVWEWHADSGLRRLETGGISGANGLELSADEHTLYASAWSGRQLLILDRRTGARRVIPFDFLPDNIKRAPDGTLFVGGQRSTVARIGACEGPACPQDWIIARVDPVRGTVTPLITRPGNALINYACGAIQVDGTLYITARGDYRLAYVPLASLPSLR